MMWVEEWLKIIKEDIKKKYNVDNPIFLIDGDELDFKDFYSYLSLYIHEYFYWFKYRHIKDNYFEIKPFSPYLEDEVSKKIIQDYLDALPQKNKKMLFSITYKDDDDGYENELLTTGFYDLNEVKRELLFLLRIGKSYLTDSMYPQENEDEVIYNISVTEDCLKNLIDQNYIDLEF